MAQPQHHVPGSEALTTAAASVPQPSFAAGIIPTTEHDPAGHPIIPDLSITGGIFVPIKSDLAAPFTPPTTRIARLREVLALLDSHSAAVQSNLLDLFTRECARITQVGRRQEAALAQDALQDIPHGLELNDLDEMIVNMTEPHNPALDYNMTAITEPEFPPVIAARSPREWTANELLRGINKAAGDLEGYENHVKRVRESYEQALKVELEREAE
ncbi:hypothetical protein G7Z17_g9671 [Cylindrodendrum hubeiense]|uniref:Uncharacterized protein n=1 Tax=Cylindrodendrum hubeiense TaxID=595255 RepID=A0A9P5H008_9HYPO|nr:hypothetical protein G7Z17_g9671 [Cylindrodendrum hubeiense]